MSSRRRQVGLLGIYGCWSHPPYAVIADLIRNLLHGGGEYWYVWIFTKSIFYPTTNDYKTKYILKAKIIVWLLPLNGMGRNSSCCSQLLTCVPLPERILSELRKWEKPLEDRGFSLRYLRKDTRRIDFTANPVYWPTTLQNYYFFIKPQGDGDFSSEQPSPLLVVGFPLIPPSYHL